jgi:hypothetical protein
MFTGLPDRLTRPVVRGACLRAADAPADAARAFLTVMAWGYGQLGYGPFEICFENEERRHFAAGSGARRDGRGPEL